MFFHLSAYVPTTSQHKVDTLDSRLSFLWEHGLYYAGTKAVGSALNNKIYFRTACLRLDIDQSCRGLPS